MNDEDSSVSWKNKAHKLCYYFIRDEVISGTIEAKFCSTKDQVVNLLTKALNYAYFMKFHGDLCASSFASRESVEV